MLNFGELRQLKAGLLDDQSSDFRREYARNPWIYRGAETKTAVKRRQNLSSALVIATSSFLAEPYRLFNSPRTRLRSRRAMLRVSR
jgi:hypothetical protein